MRTTLAFPHIVSMTVLVLILPVTGMALAAASTSVEGIAFEW